MSGAVVDTLAIIDHAKCIRKREGICMVSSGLAEDLEVRATEEACSACCRQKNPMSFNPVTIGKALLELKKNDRYDKEKHWYLAKALIEFNYASEGFNSPFDGVGTHLKRLVSWFASQTDECACGSREIIMNVWGPDRCEKNREQILGWLEEGAKSQGLPFVRFIANGILNKALRNTRADQSLTGIGASDAKVV